MNESPEYRHARAVDAAAFKDADVARAYAHRPPYPPEMIRALAARIAAPGSRVVDLGCATGDIARPLAPQVDHVDAVDFSREMIEAGRLSAGGDSPRIAWHHSPAETFAFDGPYGLAVAGESLGWMDLERLFAKLRPSLNPGAVLAVISRVETAPWEAEYLAIVKRYSKSLSYRPRDLIAEMRDAGLATLVDEAAFGPEPYRQTVEDYIELQHSRSSFARTRMSDETEAFGEELRAVLRPYADGGVVTYGFEARVAFLQPL
jgi:SAM-dependent methyltransferase